MHHKKSKSYRSLGYTYKKKGYKLTRSIFSHKYSHFHGIKKPARKTHFTEMREEIGPQANVASSRYALYSMLCVTHYCQFFGMLGADTRAMGRVLDVVWYDLSVTQNIEYPA